MFTESATYGHKMTSKRHALVFVTITVFLDTVGFGVIMPVLPEFLMQLTGGGLSETSSIAGYLVVFYASLQFLFAPVLGNLSDRYGRRSVLLISLFFYAVNYLIAGLATTLWVLFIGRILTGITSATYATANALIADVSPPEERAQNFGLLGVAFGLGFIFGPTIGGLLGEWDVRAPFFAAAGLAALNTLYGALVLKETLPADRRREFDWRRANPLGMLVQLRRYPILVGLVTAMFIYNIGHHVYPSNWNFYTIEKFNWTPLDVGLSMGLVGVLMALVQGYLIRLVIPRWGAPKTAFVGFAAAASAFIGIAFAPTALTVYLWCAVSSLAGLAGPAVASIMANQVPQNEQGELQGINASVGSIAAIIGPLMMTQSFAVFTGPGAPIYFPGVAFLLAGVLTVAALAIFSINVRVLEPGGETSAR
jgi:DHA1 family tetracycline resistance protein-like MFS transporter